MKLAYVDTSCLVAIAFQEAKHEALIRQLTDFDRLFSSNLLEAELRATMLREEVVEDCAPLMAGITWVFPQAPLTQEIRTVLSAGYVRGADLWHLACGLFLRARLSDLSFLTLDARQNTLAASLEFRTLA
jgi:hypothetical protein